MSLEISPSSHDGSTPSDGVDVAGLVKEISKSTGEDTGLRQETEQIFEQHDFLGRTWYRMREELLRLKQSSENIPPGTLEGFSWVTKSLTGLWLEARRQDAGTTRFSSPLVKMGPEEEREIEVFFKELDQQANLSSRLDDNWSIRSCVGTLMRNLNEKAQMEPDTQKRENLKEGLEIGWGRWRFLSTSGKHQLLALS